MTLASKSLITMTDYQDSFMTANLIWRGVLEQNANEPIFQCITKAQFFARNDLFSQGPMPLRDVLVKLRGRLRRKKLMHIVKFGVTWKLSFYINEKIFYCPWSPLLYTKYLQIQKINAKPRLVIFNFAK